MFRDFGRRVLSSLCYSPDDGPGFNFSDASAGALADIQGGGAGAPQGGTPAAAAPPAAGTPPAGGAPQGGAPQGATPSGQTTPQGEPLFDVKVGGRTFRVPLSELQNGYSRHSDYTQKTMALAERERQWTEYVQRLENAYQTQRQRLEDPRVAAYLQSLEVQHRPDEPLTAEQQLQLLQRQGQQVAQSLDQRFQSLAEQTQVQALAAHYNTELDNTLSRVLENPQFALLQDVPGIRQVLWQAMSERQPQNINEAKQLLLEGAKAMTDALNARFTEQQKRAAAAAAQNLSGIERPGGAPPPAVQQQPGWKLGDKDLRSAAIADVMATMK